MLPLGMTFQCSATAAAAPDLTGTVWARPRCAGRGSQRLVVGVDQLGADEALRVHVCVDVLTRMSLASREPAPPCVSMIAPARSLARQRGVLCAPAPAAAGRPRRVRRRSLRVPASRRASRLPPSSRSADATGKGEKRPVSAAARISGPDGALQIRESRHRQQGNSSALSRQGPGDCRERAAARHRGGAAVGACLLGAVSTASASKLNGIRAARAFAAGAGRSTAWTQPTGDGGLHVITEPGSPSTLDPAASRSLRPGELALPPAVARTCGRPRRQGRLRPRVKLGGGSITTRRRRQRHHRGRAPARGRRQRWQPRGRHHRAPELRRKRGRPRRPGQRHDHRDQRVGVAAGTNNDVITLNTKLKPPSGPASPRRRWGNDRRRQPRHSVGLPTAVTATIASAPTSSPPPPRSMAARQGPDHDQEPDRRRAVPVCRQILGGAGPAPSTAAGRETTSTADRTSTTRKSTSATRSRAAISRSRGAPGTWARRAVGLAGALGARPGRGCGPISTWPP